MISAIVCADMNNAIGYKGELLERIPEDMKRFKELTENSRVVMMGRKTWDSLPVKPLPNRKCSIITSNVELIEKENKDVLENIKESRLKKEIRIFDTMDNAKSFLDYFRIVSEWRKALQEEVHNIFIIGGGQIYKELIPYCDRVYLTRILHRYPNADTYFPDIESMPEWKCISCSEAKQWCDVQYQFELYERIEGES